MSPRHSGAAVAAKPRRRPVPVDRDGPGNETVLTREERIEALLRLMTPEEKLGQLTQVFSGRSREGPAWDRVVEDVRAGRVGSFLWAIPDPGVRNLMQREAVEQSRLGIPLLFGLDVIHGARTIFPIPLGLSCSFSPDLLERVQTAVARESLALGINWILGPVCDLARDVRWGRVAETCGEDPFLSALCNAAQVRGLQSLDDAGRRAAACLKHFVGVSASSGGRDHNEAEASEWTLRNIHFPPFHAGIRAGAKTVMSGFNSLGGIPVTAHDRMLNGILRSEWEFGGFVVSDWKGVDELVECGFARDRSEASVLALLAGNDVDMMTEGYRGTLNEQVVCGGLGQHTIDEAVRRVLRVKFELGLFEDPFVASGTTLRPTDSQRALARDCVAETTVMVKNDGVLPLADSVRRIAVIGPFADDAHEMLGSWSDWGRDEDVVTLAAGLAATLPAAVKVIVAEGCPAGAGSAQGLRAARRRKGRDSRSEIAAAVDAASRAEVVVMALGETRDWLPENGTRASIGLTGRQQEVFDAVARLGKPLVSVIFSGRPLSLPAVWESSGAVLYAWQPGIEGGTALAEILIGKRSPGGRLSMTIPRDIGHAPLTYNFLRTRRNGRALDREDMAGAAAFWFGTGLSFTTFVYGEPLIRRTEGASCAEVVGVVTNTGTRTDTETAQLYIRQIVCREGIRPQQELRGIQKVRLAPGERAEVRFFLDGKTLGYWTRDGRWVVDEGDYLIWIAPASCTGTAVRYRHALNPRPLPFL